jgi:hypothetical protein
MSVAKKSSTIEMIGAREKLARRFRFIMNRIAKKNRRA